MMERGERPLSILVKWMLPSTKGIILLLLINLIKMNRATFINLSSGLLSTGDQC